MTDPEKFRLSLLIPPARARAEGIIQRMIARGFREPYIGSTIRTPEEQEEALRRGATGRKQKLTWHFLKRAIDFRDRLPNGKIDPTARNEAFFLALWEEATAVGMRCLGYVKDRSGHPIKYFINGGKVWDPGHCEYRAPFTTLVEACQKEAPHLLGEPHPPDPDDDEEGAVERVLGLAGLPPSPFK